MKQYALEIVRQKWRLLGTILVLLLLNVAFVIMVSAYQAPALLELHTKWNSARRQITRSGQVDATLLHKQSSADLEKLMAKIPEKRHFARVLSELLEDAASSAVGVGTISYKPLQLKQEALLSYQMTLSVTGGYAAVKSFLSDLQNKPDLIVVESVSFSNNDPLVENVVMDLHITIYLRENV